MIKIYLLYFQIIIHYKHIKISQQFYHKMNNKKKQFYHKMNNKKKMDKSTTYQYAYVICRSLQRKRNTQRNIFDCRRSSWLSSSWRCCLQNLSDCIYNLRHGRINFFREMMEMEDNNEWDNKGMVCVWIDVHHKCMFVPWQIHKLVFLPHLHVQIEFL